MPYFFRSTICCPTARYSKWQHLLARHYFKFVRTSRARTLQLRQVSQDKEEIRVFVLPVKFPKPIRQDLYYSEKCTAEFRCVQSLPLSLIWTQQARLMWANLLCQWLGSNWPARNKQDHGEQPLAVKERTNERKNERKKKKKKKKRGFKVYWTMPVIMIFLYRNFVAISCRFAKKIVQKWCLHARTCTQPRSHAATHIRGPVHRNGR